MLDQLKVAEVSLQHVSLQDWEKLEALANANTCIQAEDVEAFLSFRWFEHKWSVLIHLGCIFVDPKLNRELDPDIKQLIRDNSLSIEFAELVLKARQEEFSYLVIDPDKEASADLPVVYDP